MHTYFIIPINPINHSDDGSNVIFDVYNTFKGGDNSCVAVDFNEPTTTDDVCTKIEEVPYGSIDLTVYVTSLLATPHYTATCIEWDEKVDI